MVISLNSQFRLGIVLAIIVFHCIALIVVPVYIFFQGFSLSYFIAAFIIGILSGFGVTIGFHRYFSHNSFKTYRWVEVILVWLSNLSIQGSVLRWVNVHRNHHRYSETHKDPHSINKGFLYAHLTWMLYRPKNNYENFISDLDKDSLLQFEDKYYLTLTIINSTLISLIVGIILGDILAAFLICFALRVVIIWHFIWSVNSFAHLFGSKPYNSKSKARNNLAVALVTLGEGYHDFHHRYPADYRNGVKWYHIDCSKWIIYLFYKLKIVKSINRLV